MTNKKDCVKFVLYQKKVVILHAIKNDRGKMPEWSIGAVSKTVVPFRYPGFESLSFRNLIRPKSDKDGQTADYQIVLRFFVSYPIGFRTDSRPRKDHFRHTFGTNLTQEFSKAFLCQICVRNIRNKLMCKRLFRPNLDINRTKYAIFGASVPNI